MKQNVTGAKLSIITRTNFFFNLKTWIIMFVESLSTKVVVKGRIVIILHLMTSCECLLFIKHVATGLLHQHLVCVSILTQVYNWTWHWMKQNVTGANIRIITRTNFFFYLKTWIIVFVESLSMSKHFGTLLNMWVLE